MHELFTKVLGKRDLSRAGDLFSVADAEIVADLTEVVSVFTFQLSEKENCRGKVSPRRIHDDYRSNYSGKISFRSQSGFIVTSFEVIFEPIK